MYPSRMLAHIHTCALQYISVVASKCMDLPTGQVQQFTDYFKQRYPAGTLHTKLLHNNTIIATCLCRAKYTV